MVRPEITPAPPYAEGTGLPWDVPVRDAVQELAVARRQHGDTFVVDSGKDRYLFTFSPTGVESFYSLPEEVASKGVADYLMLRRKLPDGIFDNRRTLPHLLFRRGDVALYLANLDHALDATTRELGSDGTVDVFGLTRRLAHRMGFASWAGPGSADGEVFERLVAAFDTLDGSEAFVHPDAMAAVAASGKEAEQEALDEVCALVGEAIDRLDRDPRLADQHGLFARILDSWSDAPSVVRREGAARDVALVHVASMSNLAAALGWAMVDLVEHPEALARVRAGDTEYAERCALETTRLAQRSIMSRHVLQPLELATGDATYSVPAGVTVATLLPLLNTSAGPGLEDWVPDRWSRHRLADTSTLASAQLVTAFGHGKHTCPAQPFSLAAMSTATASLFTAYDVQPGWRVHPQPVPAQIGGVARAAAPCPVQYQRRSRT